VLTLGCGVAGYGLKFQDPRLVVKDLGIRIQNLGSGCRIQNSWCRCRV